MLCAPNHQRRRCASWIKKEARGHLGRGLLFVDMYVAYAA